MGGKSLGNNRPPSVYVAFLRGPWGSNFPSTDMSQIRRGINESSPKNFLQYAFKVRQRRSIIEIGQSIPPNDLIYFLLGLLEFVGVKYHREHECMHRRYGLK